MWNKRLAVQTGPAFTEDPDIEIFIFFNSLSLKDCTKFTIYNRCFCKVNEQSLLLPCIQEKCCCK
jgi:hypothetical protein